jgi:hypothetical protein
LIKWKNLGGEAVEASVGYRYELFAEMFFRCPVCHAERVWEKNDLPQLGVELGFLALK